MNPITDQPRRSSFSCDRHPDNNFTGFCPSCLCERLTILDQSATAAAPASSSSRRNSTAAAAAIKSIFRVPSSSNATSEANRNKISITNRTSSLAELRRTKSFSASKNEGLGSFTSAFEPQRKSCDVRGRNTLWSLFSIDDENKPRHSSTQQQTIGSTGIFLETNKEDDEDQVHNDEDDYEIRVSEEQDARRLNDLEKDVVEMEAKIDAIVDNLKSVNHIHLDAQSKKPSFWSAASVLGKKWHKWRGKHKKSLAGGNGVVSSRALQVEKPISGPYRETQSEIADYGFGRRSCDIDPRFSLDAGRISFDDPRYSFDEPRASWDGYLIGRTFPRLPPTVKDVPVVRVPRSDAQIPVEEPANVEENIPGGSTQTREYYLDSSSKRRKSLDRSNSIRKMAAAVVAEMDERKGSAAVSNAKVSPATTIDYNHSHGRLKFRSIGGERELEREDCSETFDMGFRDNGAVIGVGEVNKEAKKSRWRTWKLWGFIHRHGTNKDGKRSYSSWQDPRSQGNGEVGGGFNRKVCRSNSSVSWRNSSYNMKKWDSTQNGKNAREADEFVLERNRSARYSPNHINNGLLPLYLTPSRGSRRGGIAKGTRKSRMSGNSHSIAKNMLRLY